MDRGRSAGSDLGRICRTLKHCVANLILFGLIACGSADHADGPADNCPSVDAGADDRPCLCTAEMAEAQAACPPSCGEPMVCVFEVGPDADAGAVPICVGVWQ